MGRRHVSNKEVKAIARRRMARLLSLAKGRAAAGDLVRARRYVDLAVRISLRGNVAMPYRAEVCKNCHTPFLAGRTCRVRLRPDRLTITCLQCGAVQRTPHVRERREMRQCRGPRRTL